MYIMRVYTYMPYTVADIHVQIFYMSTNITTKIYKVMQSYTIPLGTTQRDVSTVQQTTNM